MLNYFLQRGDTENNNALTTMLVTLVRFCWFFCTWGALLQNTVKSKQKPIMNVIVDLGLSRCFTFFSFTDCKFHTGKMWGGRQLSFNCCKIFQFGTSDSIGGWVMFIQSYVLYLQPMDAGLVYTSPNLPSRLPRTIVLKQEYTVKRVL